MMKPALNVRFAAGVSRRQVVQFLPASLLLGLGGCKKSGNTPETSDAFALRGKPAMILRRDGHANVQALASAIVCDAGGEVLKQFTPRDAAEPINIHSAVKPLHTGMLLEEMAGVKSRNSKADIPDLAAEELAVLSSSHAGTAEHRKWVRSALDKAGLDESYMVCGGRYPYDEATKNALVKQDIPAAQTPKLFDMCSGHHASQGIFARLLGEDPKNYWQPEGRIQKLYTGKLADLSGDGKTSLVKFDNCNIPTFNLSARGLATAFARFVERKAYRPVVEAMAKHPVLIDDTVSLDTRLIQVSGGNLIAKLGSEGLITVSNRDKKQALVLKEWCGNSHGNYRERITIQALQELGWLIAAQAKTLGSEAEFLMEDAKHGVRYEFNSPLWGPA